MAAAQGSVPGVEARAGKFPGPSLIPALTAIQRRHGWLPREESCGKCVLGLERGGTEARTHPRGDGG